MERWTPFIIVALPILIGLLDVILYILGGNAATISWVMLVISSKQPLIALSTCYSFSVLMGHLFFPVFQVSPPPVHEVIAKIFVALSPTIYTLIMVGFGSKAAENNANFLQNHGQLTFACYMLLAAILGGCAGRWILPQHVE